MSSTDTIGRPAGPEARRLAAVLLAMLLPYGCAAPGDSSPSRGSSAAGARGSLASRGEPVAIEVDARPAALVDGHGVLWGELRPILTEQSGAAALREIILDRRLAAMVEEREVTISEDDVAEEQTLLLATLSADPATALRLLEELRDRQQLGPRRYHALLHRNAALRTLVRDRVKVDPAAVDVLYDTLHGPKRQVRLATTKDLGSAQSIVSRVRGGAPFGDLAVEESTDASAARGGMLEPISRLDPAYPAAMRTAIWSLDAPGAVSDPILLPDGYAVVQLVRDVPADDVALDDVRERLELLARTDQERVLMDELVRNLMRNVQVTIFDDDLQDSWKRARRESR